MVVFAALAEEALIIQNQGLVVDISLASVQ
jgi:hypothetical protein